MSNCQTSAIAPILPAIVQKIVDPAQAILGYQEMVIEAVLEGGPAETLPDLRERYLALLVT